MHIAVIPDGNRRWARKRKLEDWKGHIAGEKALEKILKSAWENQDINCLTFYIFSSENLKNRPANEREKLFELLEAKMKTMLEKGGLEELHKNKVRINFWGRINKLPKSIQKPIEKIEKETKRYKKRMLNLCIAYDGRDELVDAMNSIIKKGVKKVKRETIKEHMYSKGISSPDLIIRTGMANAMRLSAFLLWDSAYSEFFFTKTLWPDFTAAKFNNAVKELSRRERRYGR